MENAVAIQRATELYRATVNKNTPVLHRNFRDFAVDVFAAARELPEKQRPVWFQDWALTFRKIYDDFDAVYRADPMIVYTPQHSVAVDFHSSKAFVRYFRAGNRCSKTQSGYAEHYFYVTGQHRWRYAPGAPNNTFIIGVNFAQYAPNVFERKLFTGEKGNPLAPMFSDGGKWLNRYDERKHILYIACKACAENQRAKNCRHPKSTITLFSDDEGASVLQGGTYTLGHLDEHVKEEFFHEGVQRTQTIPNSSFCVTGTPLLGPQMWEARLLASRVDKPNNHINPDDKESSPFVSMHEVDQYAAGLIEKHKIDAMRLTMDEFEIEARIYGRPSPLAKNPVFDRKALQEMRKHCVTPQLGLLGVNKALVEVSKSYEVEFIPSRDGLLRLWEEPKIGEQYVIAVDSAAGLTKGDASCASVLKLSSSASELHFSLVAQLHGWLDQFDYADEIFKLATWYNEGLVVVELTGGLGRGVVLRLKKDLFYWNIFRDTGKPEYAEGTMDPRFGIDTTTYSKPTMIAALQQVIRKYTLNIPCSETIAELVAYEQERSESGKTVIYKGSGGMHDDRVMSLAIGVYTVLSYPVYEQDQVVKIAVAEKRAEMNSDWAGIHKELEPSVEEFE